MSRELRTIPQVIELIKNLKKVSTKREVAELLGVHPKTLAAAAKKKGISRAITLGLIEFGKREHITIDYLITDIDAWIKEGRILRVKCGPVKQDLEGKPSNIWELYFLFETKKDKLHARIWENDLLNKRDDAVKQE